MWRLDNHGVEQHEFLTEDKCLLDRTGVGF